jgi:hypothetical protein
VHEPPFELKEKLEEDMKMHPYNPAILSYA